MNTRRRPAIRIVAAGLALALAFPSAAAACTVEEYMTAEDIASGRYDVTPPDTYGGGPAGPHTHGEVAPPPADPAAAEPGSTPAATAAPTPPPAAVAPKPIEKPSAATGNERPGRAESPTRQETPTAEGDAAKQDSSPAAAKPRRAKPAPAPQSTVPPSNVAPAPVTQTPVAAVAPTPPPTLEPVAQPTSRPAAERARQATAARRAATNQRQPRRERSASRERPAAVPLPAQVTQRRTRSTVAPPAEVVPAPRADVVRSADDGGQIPTTVVVGIAGLLGAGLLLLSRRRRPSVTATKPSAPFDDHLEAELQELLADHGIRNAEAAERAEQRSAV